jgi:predicted PhzF superfamily epimerase YddE/YHI9
VSIGDFRTTSGACECLNTMPRLLTSLALVIGLASSTAADPTIAQLAQARVDAAAKVWATFTNQQTTFTAGPERLCEWSRRWFEAQRDLPLAGPPLVVAAEAHLKRTTDLETQAKAQYNVGMINAGDLAIIRYYRAEAELLVARAKKP